MKRAYLKLTEPAAKRVAALAAELRIPRATLLRLMVVDRLTSEAFVEQLRDRHLGNRLPFQRKETSR